MLALVSLVGLFVAAISYALALALKNEYGLSAISNFLVLPLVLLSGITLPLTLAPPFLQTLGRINPLSHAVDAARALTGGDLAHAAIIPGFALFAGLLALGFSWAVSAFRSATR
jgi:ABC-2 type transport system permease protein